MLALISLLPALPFLRVAGRGLGGIVSWFIRVVIYDIVVTSISEIFGISRLFALFIFLGILGVISFVGYIMRQRMSPGVDE